MSPGETGTPGADVSPEEINDLVRRLRDIYTHLATNARHLARIEAQAEVLKVSIEALLPEEEQEPEEEPKEVDENGPV